MHFLQGSNGKILLGLLLAIFLVKGLFLSLLFPFFQQPDEQIHYARVQHSAEPEDKNWPIDQSRAPFSVDPNDISTYRLTEETVQTALLTDFDRVKFQKENTQSFSSDSATGPHEEVILSNTWSRTSEHVLNNISGTTSVYYWLAGKIEKSLTGGSIFTRFTAARMLSVVLGLLVVLLAYLTARKLDLSPYLAVLMAALVAFQPMFSVTAAQVNIDIALILAFSLFFFAGVALLRDGWDWRLFGLLVFSLLLAIFSKGPGLVLTIVFIPLLAYLACRQLCIPRKKFLWGCFVVFSLSVAVASIFAAPYITSLVGIASPSAFDSPLQSIGRYLEKTMDRGEFMDTARSYWGHFGWLDHALPDGIVTTLVTVEIISFLAVLVALIRRRPFPDYLPSRPTLLFSLGLILALQLAIRFYDWRVFDMTGQILIGQPGRYFLPNLLPHIFLVITGLGILLRTEERFRRLMQTSAVLMLLLSLYSIFDIILPRYYL